MSNLSPKIFYRRNLPHIQPPGAPLFITFRLAGSIPNAVAAAMQEEAKQKYDKIQKTADPAERAVQDYEAQRRQFAKWDAFLDACTAGPDWLRNPQIAEMVSKSLHFFDKQKYDLTAYCLMINHVHVVLTPLFQSEEKYYSIAQIMHSIKGYTARKANLLLARNGEFWQHESYDHYVRDEAELERIIAYVVRNPVKAGLAADPYTWPWTYCCNDW
jgi:putative transposase